MHFNMWNHFILLVALITCKLSFCFKKAIIFLADDGGFELGAYGNQIIKTPNIDNLAKNGVTFTNAFSTVSSCSPSRASILTGKPQHENGMYGLHHNVHHFNSFDKIKSLPNQLRRYGIKSGIIGKKHVGPDKVYKFDFEQTENQISILQVGRNITYIKLMVRQFLTKYHNTSFLLYIGFHDPHRCGHSHPEFGTFCEKFGNRFYNRSKFGLIEDWQPILYNASDVIVPRFVPNTKLSRNELSAQYTTISRMDQGIGLILKEFENFNLLNELLLIYTSDNGIPFPNGRTNLYDSGIKIPLIITNWGGHYAISKINNQLISHLDLMPIILNWFHLSKFQQINQKELFSSHSIHEITMYYPMRAIRTKQYKLIHNLNYASAYPIDQDLYVSDTFQEILNTTLQDKSLNWFKNLSSYYFRTEWELYDIINDSDESINLINMPNYTIIVSGLRQKLFEWQQATHDPWICSPHSVLLRNGQCSNLNNFQ